MRTLTNFIDEEVSRGANLVDLVDFICGYIGCSDGPTRAKAGALVQRRYERAQIIRELEREDRLEQQRQHMAWVSAIEADQDYIEEQCSG